MRNVPLALLKNPWMIIDIPRQLREAARSNATVSSSVQIVPRVEQPGAWRRLIPSTRSRSTRMTIGGMAIRKVITGKIITW